MRAFQFVGSARTLHALAAFGIIGIVLFSAIPTATARPPIESGDPTDVDYGPGPKKAASFSTRDASTGVGNPALRSHQHRLGRDAWLNYVVTRISRHFGLRK